MSTTPEIIFDTTVLSNFAAVDQIALLSLRYRSSACTTLAVVEELQRGVESGYHYLHRALSIVSLFDADGWLAVRTIDAAAEQLLYARLRTDLHAGEASCLAAAKYHALVLASDDLAARKIAGGYGVAVTGTLGILVRLVREQQLTLTVANDILHQMIQRRFRSPVTGLDELV
jgi:predicted nucleic acid-binding protein